MESEAFITVDGNEAAARVAYATNEVIAIYPITPASPMGELADAWSAAGKANVFGSRPDVIEMQSEGGAAGAVHGSLQAGALTTTFTASQGLLLMIPNMFKIAGELTSTVFHIAARSVATHALSIFGDHSDVMAARSTGWAMLASASVQEAHDLALIAQAATLESRVPLLHFFDGFRTSHEINKIACLSDEQIRAMIDPARIDEHRRRALDPDRPALRGSAQNPDVFFQAREAVNPFYDAVARIVVEKMQQFADLTGRRYDLFEYVGHPEAERIVVLMGSGCGAAVEAVTKLCEQGERVGLVKVRLFRPFDAAALVRALPATAQRVAVLDRTKEPGALGEPLYQDVVTAVAESWSNEHAERMRPEVYGGRYGLSSKEFTPAMVAGALAELAGESPRRHFTVGIRDDVTQLSIDYDNAFDTEPEDSTRALFLGLGSDGTVSASKNLVKIVGDETQLYTQGYFVYDSKKAGAVTVSHLRFSPRPIRSTYKIRGANFITCSQFHFLERMEVLEAAAPGATFLLNSPHSAGEVWSRLPVEVQQQVLEKRLQVYVVDAYEIARESGLGIRINTVMQTCGLLLMNIFPRDEAIAHIKEAIEKSYGKRGRSVVERNFAAVDAAVGAMQQLELPESVSGQLHRLPPVPDASPDFVKRVTGMMIAGRGDLLPVSALPPDGTFPTGTARFEKRSIAQTIPVWEPDICIQCGLCAMVCPHATIRTKAYDPAALAGAPDDFLSLAWSGKDLDGQRMTVQVAPDDCTGCGVCVDVCPAKRKEEVRRKAINMTEKLPVLEQERRRWDFFESLPEIEAGRVDQGTVKGSQLLTPLFEFSGACAGCGETPYLKLLTQLYGDRLLVANATGCSSIYGGNLPTTPWSQNAAGRGPAWSNSLFEDNAEFGLGMRLAADHKLQQARRLLESLSQEVGAELAEAILCASQAAPEEVQAQRERVERLAARLREIDRPEARALETLAGALVRKSVWIVGGDGWAYDIGFGGLDHVLASGRDVNVLVLDTEVYSNTGGQASKATPRAAVAKFAASGKATGKKDLGMIAVDYGNVYVAQVALGANPLQTIKAFEEAESWHGPSLILAYSHCIAHGIDMSQSMSHQKDLVKSGYWPLYRYDPRAAHNGGHPFHLDSRRPSVPLEKVVAAEGRYSMLKLTHPERAAELLALAQKDIDERWHFYEQMAGVERDLVAPAPAGERP